MSRDEIIAQIQENVGKEVRMTFTTESRDQLTPLRNVPMENQSDFIVVGRTQNMTIVNVDDEGFSNRVGNADFWTTFDDVERVEPLSSQDELQLEAARS